MFYHSHLVQVNHKWPLLVLSCSARVGPEACHNLFWHSWPRQLADKCPDEEKNHWRYSRSEFGEVLRLISTVPKWQGLFQYKQSRPFIFKHPNLKFKSFLQPYLDENLENHLTFLTRDQYKKWKKAWFQIWNQTFTFDLISEKINFFKWFIVQLIKPKNGNKSFETFKIRFYNKRKTWQICFTLFVSLTKQIGKIRIFNLENFSLSNF